MISKKYEKDSNPQTTWKFKINFRSSLQIQFKKIPKNILIKNKVFLNGFLIIFVLIEP
ncbi:hypothetical protein LEP1GSC125_2556 [Leptospira mayottensis 200901122]|uniref:Uncharacterized protein n=1 Tax=Leptospira mayottensis 200901122 TaxID=1193010 RepID=A0AA87MMQ7_9LEPT|nr:hypothetical protein LEP1GSC125_2556 [Leptospira mayottensis 200901122]